MHDLEIVWPSGRSTFTADDSPILIGRSSKATIVLSQGSVSRRHLEIVWENGSWSVTDPSTHGTFDPIGVKLSKNWAIATDSTIRVGGTEGVEIGFNLIGGHGTTSESSVGDWDQIPLNGVAGSTDRSSQPPSEGSFAGESPLRPAPVAPSSGGNHDVDFAPNAVPGQHFTDVVSAEATSESTGAAASNSDIGGTVPQPQRSLDSNNFQDNSGVGPDQANDLLNGSYGQSGGDLLNPIDPERPSASQFESPGGTSLFDEPMRHSSADPPLFDQQLPAISKPPTSSGPTEVLPDNSRIPVPTLEPELSPIARSAQTNVSEAILRLSVDGQDYSFSPGTEITVGRDPTCVVHLDERHSLVSRRHLRMTHQEGSWWLEDYSSKGTFVDDKQLKGRYRAEGAFIAHLGDRDTGTQVRITSAGTHVVPKRRNVRLPVVLAVVALFALLAAAAAFFLGSDRETDVAPADAATTQASTVMIVTIEDGRVANHSSGFLVSDDLIVTTRTVASESNPSLVGVASQQGEPTAVAYATSWVASHPYLDVAVLRVATSTRETDGGYVMATGIEGDISIPKLGLSEPSTVTPGAEINVTGFPSSPNITSTEKGVLELPTSSSTNGSISSFRMWPGCESANWQDLIPTERSRGANCSDDGNVEEALITMDMPDGSAGPGSPVIQDGKVAAIVLGQDVENPDTIHAISSESFAEWLDDIVKANG